MIKKISERDLIEGKKYLVGEPRFRGIWTCIEEKLEENIPYYVFVFTNRLDEIIELRIPKDGIYVFKEEYEKMPIIEHLREEYHLRIYTPICGRERFLDLARKMMIKND